MKSSRHRITAKLISWPWVADVSPIFTKTSVFWPPLSAHGLTNVSNVGCCIGQFYIRSYIWPVHWKSGFPPSWLPTSSLSLFLSKPWELSLGPPRNGTSVDQVICVAARQIAWNSSSTKYSPPWSVMQARSSSSYSVHFPWVLLPPECCKELFCCLLS